MVSLVFGNISLQERQERVSVGRSRRDVTGISGGGGRSGNGFGGIVLGEFRSEVGGEGGSLRWSGGGEPGVRFEEAWRVYLWSLSSSWDGS